MCVLEGEAEKSEWRNRREKRRIKYVRGWEENKERKDRNLRNRKPERKKRDRKRVTQKIKKQKIEKLKRRIQIDEENIRKIESHDVREVKKGN